jgi:hypothetical protein
MARYLALTDHYLGANWPYISAGDVIQEGVNAPIGFVPTPGCDPLDADGRQKFFNAGPQGWTDAQTSLSLSTNSQRWSSVGVGPAKCFWQPIAPGSRKFQLTTSAGAALGVFGI